MAQGEEEYLRRLGKAFREARTRAGLTQFEAAEKAGVTREYWAHVESQGRNLTFATARRLAAAVGVSLSEIILAIENGPSPKQRSPRRRG